jgi:tetratricopeptide (TPR) repeat protein
MSRRFLLAALVCTLLPSGALAESQAARRMTPAAKRHLDRGLRHYQQRHFDKAIVELKRGQGIDPRPEFLYALGQVYRARGDCKKAIQQYEEFLATGPPPQQAEAARTNIARCREGTPPTEGASRGEAPRGEAPPRGEPPPRGAVPPRGERPPEATPRPAPAAEPVETTPPSQRRFWYRDWTGHALIGGGLVLTVTGVVLWSVGRSAIDEAYAAGSYEAYEARVGRLSAADAKQKVGVVLMACGGAVIVGGVLHYVLHRPHEQGVVVSVGAGPGGASLVAAGRF